MITTRTSKQSEKIIKFLGLLLVCLVVIVYLLFKFKSAAPPPNCDLSQKTNFTGEQMWNFAIKNSVFFRKRPTQAACWFEKSAEAEYVNAFGSIARAYENGTGVEQNYETAIKWHRKGMKINNSGSYYLLGKMYEAGRGVQKSRAEAIKLYKKAEELGNSGATKRLQVLQK